MKNPVLTQLGDQIRHYRRANGLSQEELADRAGLHRTYVGGVERGERNISILNLVRIAAALHVPVSQLTEDIDDLSQSARD